MRPRRRLAARLVTALLAGSTLAGCLREQQPELPLTAHLWKQGRPPIEIKSGDSVTAGDSLYLTVIPRRALYLYVLSEDANHVRQVLYPCRGWDRSRPVAARRPQRLPPPLLGRETFWPVLAPTAHEHLLLLSCMRPIADLDDTLLSAVGGPPCGARLGSGASRWLDDLSIGGLDPGGERQNARRGTWAEPSSAQQGWIMDFDLSGSTDHG